jgi:hypothetical protein
MKTTSCLLIAAACLAQGFCLRADVLELKNGTVQNGRYLGGTSNSVRFETGSGTQEIATSQISQLKFTGTSGVLSPTGITTTNVVLQAGTTLLVRMVDSVSSRNNPGTPFTTRLEYDLGGGGVVALRSGALITGRVESSTQARRIAGQSTLDIRLTNISINGQAVPIVTSGFTEAGPESIRKAAKGAAGGAAIGAIAGDAGKGAAIGAVAGAVIRGATVTVPSGALLEFTLVQPVTLPAAVSR